MTLEEIIHAVREHATAHYTEGGWDHVVEAWDDADILEYAISALTPEEAIAKVGAEVAPLGERDDEMRAFARSERIAALGEDAV